MEVKLYSIRVDSHGSCDPVLVVYSDMCVQVSATYGDGFRCIAVCTVVGAKAVEKAYRVAEAILSRLALM